MKKIVCISIGIVCVAMIGLAVAAGMGWPRTPEEKVAYIASEIADTLELDAAQRSTLDRIAEDIVAEHREIKSDRQVFKARLIETLDQESVSPQDLKALFETKKPVIDEVMELAAGHIAEFHSILTPEQRARLIEKIESHDGRKCRFMH